MEDLEDYLSRGNCYATNALDEIQDYINMQAEDSAEGCLRAHASFKVWDSSEEESQPFLQEHSP